MTSPTQYTPLTPTDFIGPARKAASLLAGMVRQSKDNGGEPLRVLINGKPGIGKSALAKYFTTLLGCDKWSVSKYNGTQIKIEVVEDMAASLHYSNLFGDYRLLLIEEADKIPNVAQVRFLTLLDDLPPGAAVCCTSNCKLSDFEERFQTRFQPIELTAPRDCEIAELLRQWPLNSVDVSMISVGAGGNVRAALLDAQMALQNSRPLAMAA